MINTRYFYNLYRNLDNRLFDLLSKFIKVDENLIYLLSTEKYDDPIISYIKRKLRNKTEIDSYLRHLLLKQGIDPMIFYILNKKIVNKDSKIESTEYKAKQIIKWLGPNKRKIKKYLDIGCSDGLKTITIGKMLGLTKKNIYGIDIDNFAGVEIIPRNDFQFCTYQIENILPFKNNTFEFISMQQVLHHIKKQTEMLKEIKRVLKPGGILYIREHDKRDSDYNIDDLIKLEHLLYSQIFDNIPYDVYQKTKYEKYFSRKNLENRLKRLGFKILFHVDENTPTNYYNLFAQSI